MDPYPRPSTTYKIQDYMPDLSTLIRKGYRWFYEGEAAPPAMPSQCLLGLTLRAPSAWKVDLVSAWQAILQQNPAIKLKDPSLALTPIIEGWSNALLWGTLELPPKGRTCNTQFEKLLKTHLHKPSLAMRYVRLRLFQQEQETTVTIQDEGNPFDWKAACSKGLKSYSGLSIIHNCCDKVAFDPQQKLLTMRFGHIE